MIRYGAPILFVVAGFILGASQVKAQGAPSPDSDTFILYYEDENPNLLDFWLLRENICLEAVIRLNPGLDYNDIRFGTPIRAPRNEPCYNYDRTKDGWWNFYDGKPPRLKYFEDGQWLDEPYYSDEVVYKGPDSLDELAQAYDLCLQDLLNHNYLLHEFDAYRAYVRFSMDIFIPRDARRCDWPEQITSTQQPKSPGIQVAQREIRPLLFSRTYNVCPEEAGIAIDIVSNLFFGRYRGEELATIRLPEAALPCYNPEGQRLRYYDDAGHRLDHPEYSTLPIFIVPVGMDIHKVARLHNVCVIDLLRINGFPSMPMARRFELFIPPPRECPSDLQLVEISFPKLTEMALHTKICIETLHHLNPYFKYMRRGSLMHISFSSQWIILPTNQETCYQHHVVQPGVSLLELERRTNVCREAFIWVKWDGSLRTVPAIPEIRLYSRADSPPCINTQGQRLHFPGGRSAYNAYRGQPTPSYSTMPVHYFQAGETAYTISQRYNVCVHELLRANPRLVEHRPVEHPIFLPQTRPCYDEATGLPLIYEDESGAPLATPRVGHHLMYYGSQGLGRISYYYNVCINRIEDANRDKLERRAGYLGWIIPTDRPACYDAQGEQIDYVCYDQPVDFTVDHRRMSPPLAFNPDGTHCYDLAARDTLVWHDGQPYQVINYWNTMLSSRAFTAWCYGVSQDGIDAINEVPEVLALLPLHHRAIPQATRACYLDDPNALGGAGAIHTVFPGETLIDIAARYDKLPSWIAEANDLDAPDVLWPGQKLIIPASGSVEAIFARGIGFAVLLTFSAVIVGVRQWARRRVG